MESKQEKYWDGVSGQKEFQTPFRTDLFEKHVPKDAAVLDAGCGYGRTLAELHQRGFQNLAGVDFSQGMVDRGSVAYPHLRLSKMEEGVLPFGDQSFQAVLLIAALT